MQLKKVHFTSLFDETVAYRAPYPVTPASGQLSTTDHSVYYAWPAGEMTRDILLTQQDGHILTAESKTGGETSLNVLAQPLKARVHLCICVNPLKSYVRKYCCVSGDVKLWLFSISFYHHQYLLWCRDSDMFVHEGVAWTDKHTTHLFSSSYMWTWYEGYKHGCHHKQIWTWLYLSLAHVVLFSKCTLYNCFACLLAGRMWNITVLSQVYAPGVCAIMCSLWAFLQTYVWIEFIVSEDDANQIFSLKERWLISTQLLMLLLKVILHVGSIFSLSAPLFELRNDCRLLRGAKCYPAILEQTHKKHKFLTEQNFYWFNRNFRLN